MLQFDVSQFIKTNITKRNTSLFLSDLDNNRNQLTREIRGKKVLVIGGAGTIGSSFIKALLPYKPSSLIVVDYSENGLTELTRDLRSQDIYVPEEYITYPFDFGSRVFEKMFLSRSFDVVACFAAHKHVRSEKDHLAIEAMITNNVFNTKSLLDLCTQRKPKHFFSVSTDKAANPVNVMGASKQLMEKVLLSYSADLKVTTARFANVAFSNGSLLAGFIDRMMKRQPLSAPNDVKRYFVSPEESGQLCLLACILGSSGEILFPKLDVSQMMTFSGIAEDFLESLGLEPKQCQSEQEARVTAKLRNVDDHTYPVYFFSTDTSGEKAFEEFYTRVDDVDMEHFEAMGIVKKSSHPDIINLESIINKLKMAFERQDVEKSDIVRLIAELLPNFRHKETGKSLDQKM